MVAAIEPHVPGPGVSVPAPQKVAVIHAQCVCRARAFEAGFGLDSRSLPSPAGPTKLILAFRVDAATKQFLFHCFLVHIPQYIRIDNR